MFNPLNRPPMPSMNPEGPLSVDPPGQSVGGGFGGGGGWGDGLYARMVAAGYTGPQMGTPEWRDLREQGQRPYIDFRQQWRADHPGQFFWGQGLGGLGGLAQQFTHGQPNVTPGRPMNPQGVAMGEPNGLMGLADASRLPTRKQRNP